MEGLRRGNTGRSYYLFQGDSPKPRRSRITISTLNPAKMTDQSAISSVLASYSSTKFSVTSEPSLRDEGGLELAAKIPTGAFTGTGSAIDPFKFNEDAELEMCPL